MARSGLLRPVLPDADHDQLVLAQADRDVHAVDEPIGVLVETQLALAKPSGLDRPHAAQPADQRQAGRQRPRQAGSRVQVPYRVTTFEFA